MKFTSQKPQKQRKRQAERSAKAKARALSAHLDEKLAGEFKRRNIPLRRNDEVEVVRGDHSGKRGKITRVDYESNRVFIEKIVRKKSDGAEIPVGIAASNVLVREVDRSDKRRVLAHTTNRKG